MSERLTTEKKLLRELEWCGTAYGQGSGFMGSGYDGHEYAACPICHGIMPCGSNEFQESAFGHQGGCRLARALAGKPRDLKAQIRGERHA